MSTFFLYVFVPFSDTNIRKSHIRFCQVILKKNKKLCITWYIDIDIIHIFAV